jgi:hypothetical protein
VTGPLATGGRLTTLAVGGQAQLLTEFAGGTPPLLIINTGTDLAWVSGDSSVGPASGVPLEPGTALPWTTPGIVYAVADAAAAAPIPLYITSAASAWTPSPATIAAEVSTALLAAGVPNVFLSASLLDADLSNLPANTLPLDVHKYASLQIALTVGGIVTTLTAQYVFYADAAGTEVIESGTLSCNSGSAGDAPSWTIPVSGPFFSLVPTGGVGAKHINARVIGTNRPSPKRLGSDFLNPMQALTGHVLNAAPAGTVVNLTAITLTPATNCSGANGQVQYELRSTTGLTGDLFCDYIDGSGTARSELMFQNFTTTTNRFLGGHPYGFVKWRFVSNAIAGAALDLFLTIVPAAAV